MPFLLTLALAFIFIPVGGFLFCLLSFAKATFSIFHKTNYSAISVCDAHSIRSRWMTKPIYFIYLWLRMGFFFFLHFCSAAHFPASGSIVFVYINCLLRKRCTVHTAGGFKEIIIIIMIWLVIADQPSPLPIQFGRIGLVCALLCFFFFMNMLNMFWIPTFMIYQYKLDAEITLYQWICVHAQTTSPSRLSGSC